MVRTPEQGHTKRCLASAIICAVENIRDQEGLTDTEFRIAAQDNDFLREADGYLADGIATCLCPPWEQSLSEHALMEQYVLSLRATVPQHPDHDTSAAWDEVQVLRAEIARRGLDRVKVSQLSLLCFRCREAFLTVAERLDHEASGTCPLAHEAEADDEGEPYVHFGIPDDLDRRHQQDPNAD